MPSINNPLEKGILCNGKYVRFSQRDITIMNAIVMGERLKQPCSRPSRIAEKIKKNFPNLAQKKPFSIIFWFTYTSEFLKVGG